MSTTASTPTKCAASRGHNPGIRITRAANPRDRMSTTVAPGGGGRDTRHTTGGAV